MDYINWANEYIESANKINDRIINLIERKKHNDNFIDEINIDYNIGLFLSMRDECMRTAKVLLKMAEKNKGQDV